MAGLEVVDLLVGGFFVPCTLTNASGGGLFAAVNVRIHIITGVEYEMMLFFEPEEISATLPSTLPSLQPSLETKTAAYTVRTRSLRTDLIVHNMVWSCL